MVSQVTVSGLPATRTGDVRVTTSVGRPVAGMMVRRVSPWLTVPPGPDTVQVQAESEPTQAGIATVETELLGSQVGPVKVPEAPWNPLPLVVQV